VGADGAALLVCTEGADQRRMMRQKIATIGYAAAGLDASFRSKCCNEYAASRSLRSFTQALGRKQPDARNRDAERVATPGPIGETPFVPRVQGAVGREE
jgi:hypothetical protein